MLPDVDVANIPRDELPALAGRLAELQARIALRLSALAPAAAAQSRILAVDEAVAVAAAPSARWLLHATRGHRCRRDLSRKAARFDEAELRRWLAERRRS